MEPNARSRNLLALVFLIVAFLLLAVFHFMPLSEGYRGWKIWPSILEFTRELARRPGILEWPGGWEAVLLIAAYPCMALLVIAAPWFIGVLGRSRVTWWIATLLAGVSTICLWTILLRSGPGDGYFRTMLVLLVIPVLNLAGLLLIRPEQREAGLVPHAEESP